jgi:alginate O-acetyltransferase complex protein AlgI
MSYTSFNFWVIFPIIFILYWLIPCKWNTLRKVFLIVVSYLLYMTWKPAYALILLGVSVITYVGGYIFDYQQLTRGGRNRKLAVVFTILALLPLLIFKYYNFINDTISDGLSVIGLHFELPGLNWALPVGISFFTFQAVGYLLDVYHGRVKAERNFVDYLLFICFFPQVMSGPISKSEELMPQIKVSHNFSYSQGKQGLKWILWGMFTKLVIADRLGLFVDVVYANYIHYNGSTVLLASLFYTLQIYCDFAGYSLIAIGIASTLGFNLINNFKRPYFAYSITDFWHRWHISLTRWLTQQVYIPLGGSRCSKPRTYWNIFVTFLVSGIWHGANWTFIIWGSLHGLFQIIEKQLGYQQLHTKNFGVRLCRMALTFMLVNFTWIFFRSQSVGEAVGIFERIFSRFGVPDITSMGASSLIMLFIGLSILLFKELREEFFRTRFKFLDGKVARSVIYLLLSCMILNFGVFGGSSFIYVSF